MFYYHYVSYKIIIVDKSKFLSNVGSSYKNE